MLQIFNEGMIVFANLRIDFLCCPLDGTCLACCWPWDCAKSLSEYLVLIFIHSLTGITDSQKSSSHEKLCFEHTAHVFSHLKTTTYVNPTAAVNNI